MTGPMFNPGQQAASYATQQAAQQAHRTSQSAMDQGSRFARSQPGPLRPHRRGALGALGRLVLFVVWLIVLALVITVGLVILNSTDPGWLTDLKNAI